MSSEQAAELDGWLANLQGSGEGLMASIDRIMRELPTPAQIAGREPLDVGRVQGNFNVLVRHLHDANECIDEANFGNFVFKPVSHVDQPGPPGVQPVSAIPDMLRTKLEPEQEQEERRLEAALDRQDAAAAAERAAAAGGGDAKRRKGADGASAADADDAAARAAATTERVGRFNDLVVEAANHFVEHRAPFVEKLKRTEQKYRHLAGAAGAAPAGGAGARARQARAVAGGNEAPRAAAEKLFEQMGRSGELLL